MLTRSADTSPHHYLQKQAPTGRVAASLRIPSKKQRSNPRLHDVKPKVVTQERPLGPRVDSLEQSIEIVRRGIPRIENLARKFENVQTEVAAFQAGQRLRLEESLLEMRNAATDKLQAIEQR